MNIKLSAVFAVIAALTFPLCAQAASTEDFVKNAAMAGMFEIQSSQLALNQSQNSDVKSFSQQMISDHTKISDDLKSVLSQSSAPNMVLPAQLDDKHQGMLDHLQKVAGTGFDHDYAKDQIAGHEEAVSLFKDYAKSGDDPKLKDFAGQTLPTLQMHLEHAKALQSTLNQNR